MADVLVMHSDEVDEAVRIAMRIMEERVTLAKRMEAETRYVIGGDGGPVHIVMPLAHSATPGR